MTGLIRLRLRISSVRESTFPMLGKERGPTRTRNAHSYPVLKNILPRDPLSRLTATALPRGEPLGPFLTINIRWRYTP